MERQPQMILRLARWIDLLTHSIYTKDGGNKIIKLSDGDAIDACHTGTIL